MNNVIKFLVYLLVILLLVSWLITVGKSCNASESSTPQTMEVVQDPTDSASEIMEELESPDFTEELESILDEEEAIADGDNTSTSTETDAEVEETNDVEEAVPPTPTSSEKKIVEPAPEPVRPQSSTSTSTSTGSGKFLVIAGSYIHPDNADRQSRKLSDKGYAAEVVSFELSEYHTVLAGRYDSYDDAQKTVNRLSSDGFDAYVKRRTR